MELKEEYISHRKQPEGNYLIKCKKTYGILFLWRWLGTTSKDVEYYGSSTVWRHFDTFKRCSTFQEGWLADIYASIKYEESIEKQKLQRALI